MKTYEVELQALLTEEQYKLLKKHFDSLAKGEPDDADTLPSLTKTLT